MLRLGFWKRDNGNFVMKKDGLTEDEIKSLQGLKVGDRLIIWNNHDKRSVNSPDMTLKVFSAYEDTKAPAGGGFKPVKT